MALCGGAGIPAGAFACGLVCVAATVAREFSVCRSVGGFEFAFVFPGSASRLIGAFVFGFAFAGATGLPLFCGAAILAANLISGGRFSHHFTAGGALFARAGQPLLLLAF
jgi:hypothetical protein